MISLHDHHVLEFSVDALAKRLRLRTAFPESAGPEFAEAVFENVAGYVIDGDALGTIIFDIEEVDALALYDEFGTTMQATYRRSGAHASWALTREDAERFFRDNSIKAYSLESSIGFTGAIWAHSLVTRSLTTTRA